MVNINSSLVKSCKVIQNAQLMPIEIEEYPELDFDLTENQLRRLIDFYRNKIRQRNWGPNKDPQDMLFTLMAADLCLRELASPTPPLKM